MQARKIVASALMVMVLSAFQLRGCGGSSETPSECEGLKKEEYELTYWRVWEDQTVMDEIIMDYQELYPEVQIEVVTKNALTIYDEFEASLIRGNPPDLISLRNDWFADLSGRLVPSDPATWDTELTTEIFEQNALYSKCGLAENFDTLDPAISESDVKRNFTSTVYDDLVVEGKVYGTSIYVQPLVLYYNKNLLRTANPPIDEPPTTWEQVREYSRRITRDVNGRRPGDLGFDPNNLNVSGIALGYNSDTVNRATDIVSAMFMQAGISMVNRSATVPTFNQSTTQIQPEEVLDLYTSFADPSSDNYSYNTNFNNSSGAGQAFRDGKVAMLINYPHKLQGGELGYWDASRSIDPETGRSPKFDLGLAPLPRFAQSGRDVTYSSYFAEAVVSQDRPKEAWDFLRYLSSIDFAQYQESPAYTFASRTNLPTAVRSNDFLSEQQNITFERFSNRINFDTGEPLLEVAIRETLKAETYQKRNYQEFENQIDNMILAVNLFKNPFEVSNRIGVSSLRPRDAIDKAIRDITEIINQ